MNVTDPPRLVVDLFAGPGGWDTGLGMLDLSLRVVGIEWDRAACLTGHTAGHARVQADVARFDPSGMTGAHLLIASPPCQGWSRSGKRRGILDQAAIFAHAMRVTAAGEWIDYADAGPLPMGEGDEGGTWHDARSPLVLEVLRWVLAVQPANICLEQVPDVLPFWELVARWLRGQGYSVWAGCLSSERYGVPQTRERAILIASRERAVSAPPPTHTAYDSRLTDGGKWHGTDGDLFGGDLQPWVSMAEALPRTQPAAIYRNGNQANAARRGVDEPAPTVMFSERSNKVEWILAQARNSGPGAEREPRPVSAPSYTIRAQGSGSHPSGVEWVRGEGESVRVTVQEAAILQSFPPDYPWRGSKSAQHRQVGDAVPPLLAAHVIAACLGVQVESLERAA